MNTTLWELENVWSFEDAVAAHDVLNELDRLAQRELEKAKSR